MISPRKRAGPAPPGGPRFSFVNALVREEGPVICARMGLDRTKDASFDYASEKLSISALVRKRDGGLVCQDTAIVFIGEHFAAVGVFDGFQEAGTALSAMAADSALEVLRGGRFSSLLAQAYERLFQKTLPDEALKKGGTTATIALVQSDGGIYGNGAGDSALYRIRRGSVERLLEYRLGPKRKPVEEMTAEEYFDTRHLVSNPIDLKWFDKSRVMGYGGIMPAPESVLAASDGVTKNLRIRFDPETGLVIDNSGCEHLQRRLMGLCSPAEMISTIDDTVMGAFRYQEKSGIALEPENDDYSAAVLTMHALSDGQ
ncbi:MAG: hypothetical protein AB1324_08175 [Candidatus Micrarchaeota archaeon]